MRYGPGVLAKPRRRETCQQGQQRNRNPPAGGSIFETELDEQKQRYDVLTERIKTRKSDLGQAEYGEQRLTLRERRKGLVAERQEVVASMEEIESQLAVLAEGEQVVERAPHRKPKLRRGHRPGRRKTGRASRKRPRLILLTLSKPFLLELIRIPAGESRWAAIRGGTEECRRT